MRRTIIYLSVSAVISAFAACGGSTPSSPGGSTTTTTTTAGSTTTSTSSTSTTSTSTTTTITNPMNDSCAAADKHDIVLDAPALVINSTTDGVANNFTSACSGMIKDSGALVYELTTAKEGTFKLSVTAAAGSALKPALIVRTTACDTDDKPPYCFELGSTTETFKADLKPGTYWFIVGGLNGTNGAFQLTAQLTTPACGDGVVNAGEDCDPGTPFPMNSGCNMPGTANQCKFISMDSTCPGTIVNVAANATNFLGDSGTTTGFKDHAASQDSTCQCGTGAPERVYQVVPAKTGMMTVMVGNDTGNMKSYCAESNNMPTTTCWEYCLYVRTNCADATSEITCDQPLPPTPATLTFPVTAATPYFVYVDGLTNDMYSYGSYNLYITLQ